MRKQTDCGKRSGQITDFCAEPIWQYNYALPVALFFFNLGPAVESSREHCFRPRSWERACDHVLRSCQPQVSMSTSQTRKATRDASDGGAVNVRDAREVKNQPRLPLLNGRRHNRR